MSKTEIGAQLFTVREYTKTMPDIIETFRKIKEIGYKNIQISGFGKVDPADVAKAVEDSGLKVAATHMGWSRFQEDLDAVIEEHKMWGCTHTAVGGIPKTYHTLDGAKQFIDELGPIAEKLSQNGMDFSYHNHNSELAHVGGMPWLQYVYEQADPAVLKAEIDVYWIQAGGGDPVQWLRMCAGRMPVMHLKDMTINSERELNFAPIGGGNMNWEGIMQACQDGGVECALVEQDQTYGEDPFDCLKKSYDFLAGMGYE